MATKKVIRNSKSQWTCPSNKPVKVKAHWRHYKNSHKIFIDRYCRAMPMTKKRIALLRRIKLLRIMCMLKLLRLQIALM